ncbi:hypothetical protein AX14_005755 [Amanita brunnescens Koide BX004]|nr:hypothetical protein AX14_005755 [Amanita brunnescens Koide BX004]
MALINDMAVNIRGITGGGGGSGKKGGDGGRGGDAIVNIYSQPSSSLFDILRPHVVFSALYDSDVRDREHAVTCQPETQTKVLTDIRSWAGNTTATPMCWLSGPAGTGKTTVAHTIAEGYDKCGRLAATFFFWRKTGDRDDISKLVATLAWQIAHKIPSAKEQIEEALKKSGVPLPERSLENQLLTLLVRGPVTHVDPAGPNLIVIDGLDECASQDRIIWLIDCLRKNRLPFRFLLTSRPEPDIEASFAYHPGGGLIEVQPFSLTESRYDIRKYFIEKLEKIRQCRLPSYSPSDWPPKPYIDELVNKSEGLFVYASTAVLYIGGKGHAEERLKNVLQLHKGLDSLYDQVIREAKKWDNFDIVMGSLMYLRYPLTIDQLSAVLLNVDSRLDSPVICSALRGCHSILTIPADFDTEIEFYHASLRDFLTDESRSGLGSPFPTLFYTPTMFHAQLMVGCLGAITSAFNNDTIAPEYALVSWYYHAGLFLSVPLGSEGLGGLRDEEAEELVKKIDVKWVKSWLVQALGWAGVPYLIQQLPLKEDVADRDWTRHLKQKMRCISKILQVGHCPLTMKVIY